MMPTTAPSETATTAGARDHARAQEAEALARGDRIRPTVPAASAPPPEGVTPEDVVWSDLVARGGYAHRRVAVGTTIRLTDVEGDACAHLLLFNALEPWERLNVADTVKVQWQAYAGPGYLLLSDQGRVLASVLADESGMHDTMYGTSSQARNEERYGDGSPEGPSPAGRELLLLGGVKHGLGRRDLPPSVSFFKGVRIDGDGRPVWKGSAGAGRSVLLRAELPLVVLLANAPHPIDPRPTYTVSPLQVTAWQGPPTGPADDSWHATPEGRRGFENTLDYRKGLGL